jgi:hypothetical protein
VLLPSNPSETEDEEVPTTERTRLVGVDFFVGCVCVQDEVNLDKSCPRWEAVLSSFAERTSWTLGHI